MTDTVVFLDLKDAVRTGVSQGQHYGVFADPHAPPGMRWRWVVNYCRTFDFVGRGATLEEALAAAKAQIEELVKR